MYILYGCYDDYDVNDWTGESQTEQIREPIAKFSTLELAKKYVESCRVKKERRGSFRTSYKFRKRTLLAMYSWADIEEEIEEYLPIDPEPPK